MPATKISGLTIDSAPHRTNDFVPTYDASAVATKRVALDNLGVIPIVAEFNGLSPADATTYYWGPIAFNVGTTATTRRMYIQRAGIITACHMFIICSTGTSETSTVSIRLNNTTDTTVTSTLALNTQPLVISNTSLSITVAVGDYIEMKWVTPTWVTNPTGVSLSARIILE